jgi:uroporphyrin-III C-methyltransferase
MQQLELMAQRGEIVLEPRPYQPPEAGRYALAFAATSNREVNRQVYDDARAHNVWVNVADDPELCSFHLPARVQRGRLQLTVASAGEAPFVVRRLRQLLERRFGAEWGEWIEAAARFRQAVREQELPRAEREDRYDSFFGGTVDPQRLVARVPSREEQASLLLGKRTPSYPPGAFPSVRRPVPVGQRRAGGKVGLVSLVGAGPGDGRLLTLRGRQRLMAADAVVCDRLALTALPCDLPQHVRIHGVGKEAGSHPVPQDEITALLIRLALDGKRVVRLKGGDPYVFGRGGEEALALEEAGVPFEVVPGVTAGVAVPAYAGVPVTHRREAVRVTMLTAHEAIKSCGDQVRWDLLAADSNATLVGYMGVTGLSGAVQRLLDAGLSPQTPAAMICCGTTSAQRVVRASVADLPDAIAAAEAKPPGLFVIGPTVAHATQLDWFGRRPLQGQRLVVVSPSTTLGEELELAGAEVVEVPLPVTPAARLVMGSLPLTGCVLRDANEVEALDDERGGAGWGQDVVAWCLSAEAQQRAETLGWQRVEAAPKTELVKAMGRVQDARRARVRSCQPDLHEAKSMERE